MQPESLVFAVATFLIERGHHEAASDLADNAQTAVAYLDGTPESEANSHDNATYRANRIF